ncbi:MAG: DNA mismatch repair protein MutS, partial [Deltaproteobacteria bacterium]|nr:DNA mismatch repair protein MutS [Deltaproteobacteria bacterium]
MTSNQKDQGDSREKEPGEFSLGGDREALGPLGGKEILAPLGGQEAVRPLAGKGPKAFGGKVWASWEGLGESSLTPALRQFFEAKRQVPDSVLFFQMGDFYELFFEDATLAAPLLDLALTSRQKINGLPVPLCGIPLSTVDNYANRLVAQGYKVTICDQIGKFGPGMGLAKRQITRIVTPATVLSQDVQSKGKYLAAFYREDDEYCLTAVDLSTGDFAAGRFYDFTSFQTAVRTLEPSEIIIDSETYENVKVFAASLDVLVTNLSPENFDPELGRNELVSALGSEIGQRVFTGWTGLLAAAGATLAYLKGLTGGKGLRHLSEPRMLWERGFMALDEAATRNLELFRSSRDGSEKAALIAQIDRTKTPMGARLIRDYLARPLIERSRIEKRLSAVENLLTDLFTRNELTDKLSRLGDLERALSRLTLGRGTVRDLVTVRTALETAPKVKEILLGCQSELLRGLGEGLEPLEKLLRKIKMTMVDEVPLGASETVIRNGVSSVLDDLRELETGGLKALAVLEASEKMKTGINALKVGYNRVHGYYLEVTKLNVNNVPSDWTRKQTLSGAERYVTEELKVWEEKILTAGEKRRELETKILNHLKDTVAKDVTKIKALAHIFARTDVLAALAESAESLGWVKPSYTEDNLIDITGGRHPVVEHFLPAGETFVANDVKLSHSERLLIITGPNMAGKSTVLRQTALIVILGQMGSFVPAQKALLSVRDRVFTRVGAFDDLARGQSTFMVEMSETARILKEASNRSL